MPLIWGPCFAMIHRSKLPKAFYFTGPTLAGVLSNSSQDKKIKDTCFLNVFWTVVFSSASYSLKGIQFANLGDLQRIPIHLEACCNQLCGIINGLHLMALWA